MTIFNNKSVDGDKDTNLVSREIAKDIRALMTRNGIRKLAHAKTLSEILDLSFSQTHRKLNGQSNWDVAQIKAVADFFGEPFSTFDTTALPQNSVSGAKSFPANLIIENREIPCRISIGGPLHHPRNADFVALKQGDAWKVVEANNVSGNGILYKLTKLEISLRQARQLSIAVLDDDETSANNLVEYLIDNGFQAEAFYTLESLIKNNSETSFDAYVLDWILGTETAEPLIKKIRSSEDSPVPIFLLTGEFNSGRVHESEMARIIINYDVNCQEKPTRLPIIAAELSKALGI